MAAVAAAVCVGTAAAVATAVVVDFVGVAAAVVVDRGSWSDAHTEAAVAAANVGDTWGRLWW